mgnify:CR=1 FL=1
MTSWKAPNPMDRRFFAQKAVNNLRSSVGQALEDGLATQCEISRLRAKHAALSISLNNANNPALSAETSPLFSKVHLRVFAKPTFCKKRTQDVA